jgi:hypothetical protein
MWTSNPASKETSRCHNSEDNLNVRSHGNLNQLSGVRTRPHHNVTFLLNGSVSTLRKKNEAIPVTGRGGKQGRETSKPPHLLYNRLTDGDEVVGLTHRPLYPQEDYLDSFLLEAESTPGSQCDWKFNDLIGNRTSNLSACIIVLQPNMLPCAPTTICGEEETKIKFFKSEM